MTNRKFNFCQRFQNFKNYINTKLCDIVIAFFEKIEYVINVIDFLTFYIKNNFKYNDFNVVVQSTLIAKIINEKQNVNAYAKSIIIIANNFSNNCRSNVVQNQSIIFNHYSIFWIDFDKNFATNIHHNNAMFEHNDDENKQNEQTLKQILSLICNEFLFIEQQNIVANTYEFAFSTCSKKKYKKKIYETRHRKIERKKNNINK